MTDKKRKIKLPKEKKHVLKKKELKKPKSKESKPREEYVYSKIDDFVDDEKDRIYVYATFLACSGIYHAAEKYLCVAKLIDDSVNPKAGKKFISCTFFARNKDEIPKPSKIGSIIRIHRGYTHEYKKNYQLNCDVDIKSAWIMFDPTEGSLPVAHSGKSYTWVGKDDGRLKEMRRFSKDFFGKNELDAVTLSAAMKKEPKEFDTLALVLDVKKKEKEVSFLICDEEKWVKLKADKERFPTIGPQEVVLIRAAEFQQKGFTKIHMKDWGNMMIVPKEFASAKNLHALLKGKKAAEEIRSMIEVYTPQLEKENIITKVLKEKTAKVTPLKDLVAETGKGKQKLFRISCNVVEVGPKNPEEWLMVHDTKTKEMLKLEEVFGKGKGNALPAGKEFYYKMQLFVKDKSKTEDQNMYIIFLCTIDGKGSEFFNIGLKKEKPTEAQKGKLKKIYKAMTRPWNTLDLIVEPIEVAGGQTVFFIVDTQLNI
jgi:hypothetical protein